ncbi:C25 family cysteine peptidase [Roseibacillus ishigakijimensis]|uniref:Gingipain domain-containing protein n=1 Tax=Roseibacillus ishigakijimensis TaxID=454146 RepID=A0A934VJE1_9BACT|nr:C25 family cysteine peptidase [Roseibacillus ishigakijimensis]MBK1832504.1 hypothetical protein [Roseibacillus ishigakijimensis]
MKRTLGILAMGIVVASISFAQEKETWVSLDGKSPEGSPLRIEVVEASEGETVFEYQIPGFYQTTVNFGEEEFTSIRFVEPELGGLGFPREPGGPGWWSFAEESKEEASVGERFRKAFQIAMPQEGIPEKIGREGIQDLASLLKAGVSPAGARPGIPRLQGLASVHPGSAAKHLELNGEPLEGRRVKLSAPLAPAGYSGLDQEDKGPFGFLAPQFIDRAYYEKPSDSPQPQIELLGNAGQFAAAQLSWPLVEYLNPGEIEVVWRGRIYLKHLAGPIQYECPYGWDHWLFKLPFINGEAIREAMTAKGIKIESSRSARYLILTPRGYRDELDEFARWKNSKGLSVDFAYVGSGVGDDVAANRGSIDAYLEEYFKKHYCHGVYVLLVGDVDTIPSGRSSHVTAGPDFASTDSDHVYEVLGNDVFPSLYVGRLSVDNEEELLVQLAKILSYERNPVSGDWPTRALLAANSQNSNGNYGVDPTHPSKYAAAVNEIAGYGSYSNPPAFEVLHAGAANSSTYRAVNQDVIDSIDEGVGHVLYRGHGGQSSWVAGWDGSSSYGNSFDRFNDLPALDNNAFPIVYSISCQNGLLRANDSIAEDWMNLADTGAVAHFGAAANSYTSENHERAKGIFRAIYESGFTRLGPALAQAELLSYNSTGGGSSWKSNTFCYNLLGDPELTIRKRRVSIPSWQGTLVFENPYQPRVQVSASGGSLSGYLVSLKLKNGDTLTGVTDGNGEVPFKVADPALILNYSITGPDGSKEFQPELPAPTREWCPLVAESPEGTPITVEICSCSENETEIELRVAGFWKIKVTYGDREFTRIELPEVVTLGEGLPELEDLDAATNLIGLRGLLGEKGLLADREQLLPKNQRGWFNFPVEDPAAELSKTKYMLNLRTGAPRPVFPEQAVGQMPRNGEEMLKLGIDPRGARPGIPHVRGLIAAAVGAKVGQELRLETIEESLRDFPEEPILVPGGFQGSDQEAHTGYRAPELVDEAFLANLKEPYRGDFVGLTQPERMGGFEGCEFQIPLCEVGGQPGFRVVERARFRIVHPINLGKARDCIPYDVWVNKPAFLNGASLLAKANRLRIPVVSIRSARYLILTPREYVDDLADFIAWKRQKGLTVDVATVGTSPLDPIGKDWEEVDEYIENYYHRNYCHGVYVLLVGDTEVIPSGRSDYIDAGPDFAANGASDHVYEVIGDNKFASLYVGRLSVDYDDAADLENQLGKILAYERNPAFGAWPLRATIAANSENDNGTRGVSAAFPSKYARAANQIVDYPDYDLQPTFNLLHAGASSASDPRATNQDLINAINSGTGHVLYRGHGNTSEMIAGWDGTSSWGNSFEASELASLTNGAFPICYSIACQNNRIGQSDCLGEEFMSLEDAGAVAFWSASVNSYTSENHERAKGVFRAIFENGFNRLGPALAEAERLSSLNYGIDGCWDNNTFCYLLLGDPELTIRKAAVGLNPRFVYNGDLFNVGGGRELVVRDTLENAAKGLRVNLVFEDGSSFSGLTDDEGKLMLETDPVLQVAQMVVLDGEDLPQNIETVVTPSPLIYLSNQTVPEGPGNGTVVGTFTAHWEGVGPVESIVLAGGTGSEDNNQFGIVAGDLVFNGLADHEIRSEYSIRYRVTFPGESPIEKVAVISVLDDRSEDADGDGLTELQEEETYGTSDNDPDSDGDSLDDGTEVGLLALGLDPMVDDSSRIALLRESGFFTKGDLETVTPGQLVIEKSGSGFAMGLQMERWNELLLQWDKAGTEVEWTYTPPAEENKALLRVVPKEAAED